jgi:hypothetical protein
MQSIRARPSIGLLVWSAVLATLCNDNAVAQRGVDGPVLSSVASEALHSSMLQSISIMAAVCDMLNGHQLQQFLPMGLHAQPELDPKKQICFDFTKANIHNEDRICLDQQHHRHVLHWLCHT